MDRSDWSRRFSTGDNFFGVVFSCIVTKRRMDVLAGSICSMEPRVCRPRRLASYTLVGSRFQRRPRTTSDLDTTTLIVEVEPFVAVKDYESTAQRAVMSYHKLPAIGDIALFLQTRRGGFCCNRCIQDRICTPPKRMDRRCYTEAGFGGDLLRAPRQSELLNLR